MRIRFENRANQVGIIMRGKWIGIEVPCGEEAADEVAARLADAFGTSVEFVKDGIRFYLKEDHLSGDWKSKLDEILDGFREALPPGITEEYSITQLADADWAEGWKVHFKPLRIGRHFLVCPTWEKADPRAGDRIILMDPGMAFGTGHHETTMLCLEWLENRAEKTEAESLGSLIDLGTGSGILSIAASFLGFSPVLGVDNDPEAIEVAGQNITLNHLDSKIDLLNGTIDEASGTFDVVIANIQSLPLIRMAPLLLRCVKPGGRIVLSGVLNEQAEDVRKAYENEGTVLLNTSTAGEWCLLEFEPA